MAERRMFSNRILNSAKFLQMPTESQLLYFHMILRADDDGVVESYPLVKMLGIPTDNFKVLIAKGFIRELNEDQVIVITDWLEHNKIRADRKVNSIYLPLLKEKYPELPIIEPKPRKDVDDNSRRIGGGQSTVSVGEDSIGKYRIEEKASSFKKPKPFYKPTGEEMRFAQNKWWVIPKVGGEWLEFAGSVKNDIEYK